jgi:adenosylmethionine-8-amino-7-oxononanoate aminotransferase
MAQLQALFVEQGVWIRPFGRLIYIMPPFVMPSAELSQLTQAIGVGLDSMV